MRLVNKRDVPNLDLYIQLAESEVYGNNFKVPMTKLNKRTIKRLIITFLPYLTLMGAWIAIGCSNNLLVIVASFYLGSTSVSYLTLDKRENEKAWNNPDQKGISPEVDLCRMRNPHRQKSVSDYYRPNFKVYMESETSAEDKKYDEVASSQASVNQNHNEILNQEETISQISHEIDLYYDAYKLPKSVMTNKEWDALFDYTFELFKEKEITNVYYQSMAEFIRVVLGLVLVLDRNTLSLSDFANNLSYLKTVISHSTPVIISKKELNTLKQKLEGNIEVHEVKSVRNSKVIDFSEQKSRRLK